MSARLSPFIPLTILPVLSVWADSSKILITYNQVQVWSKRRNHLWDFIGHPLGEVVSILNCLVGAFPLLQSHHLVFLKRTSFERLIATWFKIWMNIFMLQMRMGARVLICSRCWARLSRWLGFKRSFWRPSTSWDTWYSRRGDILFWPQICTFDHNQTGRLRWDWRGFIPSSTIRCPSNEWDWGVNRLKAIENKNINGCYAGRISARYCHFSREKNIELPTKWPKT